jgi:hypothetical protein
MTRFLAHGLKQGRLLIAGAVALGAFAAPALAAECAPREQIAQLLASNYHEKPVGMGVTNSGALTVIYASPAGTWTAVAVRPSGAACVLDVGDGWTDVSSPGVSAQAE